MRIAILVFLSLISTGIFAQYAPTSAKTAFKNGVSLGSKDSTTFGSNDSLVVTIDRNGQLLWRGNGASATWKVAGTVSDLSQYLKKSDSLSGGYTTWLLTKKKVDSLGVLKLNISDTATMLLPFVQYSDTAAIVAGYVRSNRFTDSLTAVQARIQTKQPLGAYITLADSTTILAGRWLPNRSADSIAVIRALANTKLNISDTAAMLSNYRRKTTLIENADLRNSAITINGSSTSLGGSISVGTVTSVSAGTGMNFTTITSTGAVNADTTVLATRAYAAGLDVAKANTSLNNVNGVLSSTYGGAGSVSGLLKANGSGAVSAAVAGTDYVIPSALGSYLLLSGGTLTGDLTISKASPLTNYNRTATNEFNGIRLQTSSANNWGVGTAWNGASTDFEVYNYSLGTTALKLNYSNNNATLTGALSGTSLSMSGGADITGITSVNRIDVRTGNPLLFWNPGSTEYGRFSLDTSNNLIYNVGGGGTLLSVSSAGLLSGTSASFSGEVTAGGLVSLGGLGTLSDRALRIYRSGTSYIVIQNDATGTTTNDGSAIGYPIGDQTLVIVNREPAPLDLATSNAATSFRVDADGRLLMGVRSLPTNNGTDALQVAGSGLFSGALTVNSNIEAANGYLRTYDATATNGSGYPIETYTNTTGSTRGVIGRWGVVQDGASQQSGQFTINLWNSGTQSEVLNIRKTGAATFSSSLTATSASLTASTASSSTTTGALVVTGGVGVGGQVTANTIVKSGGASTEALMANGSVQTVTSGTYTPTITAGINVSSASVDQDPTYTRIGNIVTVYGSISITPSSSASLCYTTISLPVSSNLATTNDLIGNGVQIGSSVNIDIIANTSDDIGLIRFISNNTSNNVFKFSFSYQVK